jgi:SAM-dependent methyltransferase
MSPETETTREGQQAKLLVWATGCAAMRMAYYGIRLGLLSALHQAPTGLSSDEVAEQLGLDPRYVAAWAKAASAAGVLAYDPASGRFSPAPYVAELLLDENSPHYMGGIPVTLAVESRLVDRLAQCMREGGGIPFAEYGQEMAEGLSALSKPAYERWLPQVWLPGVEGLQERLAGGGKVLELGCGTGIGLVVLAGAFPQCTVTGLDPDEATVELARQRIAEAGLEGRVFAEQMRSEHLSAEGEFDLVYAQNALHGTEDPPLVVANTHRALTEGGVLLVIEVRGAARVEDAVGPVQALLTHMDLYYEIPQALARGGPGVGFLSPEQVTGMVREAGFKQVQEIPSDHPSFAAFYACRE